MANPTSDDGLKYIGPDRVIGVPACDLTHEEVKKHGREFLLSTGVYREHKKVFTPKPTKSALKVSPMNEAEKE